MVTVALACYSAVSPRTLPVAEYNARFQENLRIVSLAVIVPVINLLGVFDGKENDINSVIHTFFSAFTAGYGLTFIMEIAVATLIRLGVFACLERDIFTLTPRAPALVLPWVLRDVKYRPKRITLFAADFCTSCVASPIIEEYVKLLILQWTVNLPRNFRSVTKTKNIKGKKRSRRVVEAIVRLPGEPEVVNANPYVTHMLAASLGIKLCDAARRILMYTKPHHADKSFYAFFRGFFPIQELCGTMTALGLAKRDLLGVDLPLWKILAPAVVVHGLSNFRGMKVSCFMLDVYFSRVVPFANFLVLIYLGTCSSQYSNGIPRCHGRKCNCHRFRYPTRQRCPSSSRKATPSLCGSSFSAD